VKSMVSSSHPWQTQGSFKTTKHKRNGQLPPVGGGAPFALSGSRWSAILYRPPYGLTGWGKLHTGHAVVLRTVTLHLPTNLPPPLHSDVIM
jgi:hypothetical protein